MIDTDPPPLFPGGTPNSFSVPRPAQSCQSYTPVTFLIFENLRALCDGVVELVAYNSGNSGSTGIIA
jgi:hypothetical protein